MTYKDLIGRAKTLKCEESRAGLDHYFEIVVLKADLAPVEALFQEYFGKPYKMKGQVPSSEIQAKARPFGGIQTGQTMYLKGGENGLEVACLWPWSDGLYITVKIMTEKK